MVSVGVLELTWFFVPCHCRWIRRGTSRRLPCPFGCLCGWTQCRLGWLASSCLFEATCIVKAVAVPFLQWTVCAMWPWRQWREWFGFMHPRQCRYMCSSHTTSLSHCAQYQMVFVLWKLMSKANCLYMYIPCSIVNKMNTSQACLLNINIVQLCAVESFDLVLVLCLESMLVCQPTHVYRLIG